jgi:hypothetical protein
MACVYAGGKASSKASDAYAKILTHSMTNDYSYIHTYNIERGTECVRGHIVVLVALSHFLYAKS